MVQRLQVMPQIYFGMIPIIGWGLVRMHRVQQLEVGKIGMQGLANVDFKRCEFYNDGDGTIVLQDSMVSGVIYIQVDHLMLIYGVK